MQDPYLVTENGINLNLVIVPGASSSGFAGTIENGEPAGKTAIKLRLTARALEGQANAALCLYLSKFFAVPKTCVSIVRGQKARRKTVFIEGNPEALSAKIKSL